MGNGTIHLSDLPFWSLEPKYQHNFWTRLRGGADQTTHMIEYVKLVPFLFVRRDFLFSPEWVLAARYSACKPIYPRISLKDYGGDKK
jgi:hypothetical protein